MSPAQKNFLGSSLAALSVLAFAFEWWFARNLEFFYLTGFLLLSVLFFFAVVLLSFGIFFPQIRKTFPKTGKKWLFLFGVIDVFAFGFFFLAILEISVVKTLLWVGLTSFYVLFLSPIFLEEKLTKRKFFAAVLGFGGMAIYLVLGEKKFDFLTFSKGDLYAFLCGVSMTGFYLIGGKIKHQPLFWKLWFTWIPGALALPLFFCFFGQNFTFDSFINASFLLSFLGILVFSIIIAMVCYQLSVRYIESSKISIIRLLEPVFQGVTAFLIANETLNIWQGVGAIVMLWGIFLLRK